MDLPERSPAHGGTLGRTATRPTQAVRRTEVGESTRALSPAKPAHAKVVFFHDRLENQGKNNTYGPVLLTVGGQISHMIYYH